MRLFKSADITEVSFLHQLHYASGIVNQLCELEAAVISRLVCIYMYVRILLPSISFVREAGNGCVMVYKARVKQRLEAVNTMSKSEQFPGRTWH